MNNIDKNLTACLKILDYNVLQNLQNNNSTRKTWRKICDNFFKQVLHIENSVN